MNALTKKALILRSCYLFYVEGMNIQEVARHLGISRFRVSRYLREAREQGIVEVQIRDPRIEYEQIAMNLERTFPLQMAVVVPEPYEGDVAAIRLAIGAAGAQLLLEEIQPEMSIGISWGRTVAHMVDRLPRETVQARRVVELSGGLGEISSGVHAHDVASRCAQRLKSECVFVQAPVIVEKVETARSMLGERSIARALEMAAQCDLAVVGVGPANVDNVYSASHLLSTRDLERLKAAGAIGSIIGRFYDVNGKECNTEYRDRAITLTLDAFCRIPKRIVLAGGEQKAEGILALVRSGLISILVTDSGTASAMLAMNQSQRPADRHDEVDT